MAEAHDNELMKIQEVEGSVRKNADVLYGCVGEVFRLFDSHTAGGTLGSDIAFNLQGIGKNHTDLAQHNPDRMSIASIRDIHTSQDVIGIQVGIEESLPPLSESGSFQVWSLVTDKLSGETRWTIRASGHGKSDTFRVTLTGTEISLQRQDEKHEYPEGISVSFTDHEKGGQAKMLATKILSTTGLMKDRMPEMEASIAESRKSIRESATVLASIPDIAGSLTRNGASELRVRVDAIARTITVEPFGFTEPFEEGAVSSGASWEYVLQNPLPDGTYDGVTIHKLTHPRDEAVASVSVNRVTDTPYIIPNTRIVEREQMGFPDVTMPSTAHMYAKAFRETVKLFAEKFPGFGAVTHELPFEKVMTLVTGAVLDKSHVGMIVMPKTAPTETIVRQMTEKLNEMAVTWEPRIDPTEKPEIIAMTIRTEAIRLLAEHFNRNGHEKRKKPTVDENRYIEVLNGALDEVHAGKEMTQPKEARFVLAIVLERYTKQATHNQAEITRMLDLLQSVSGVRAVPVIDLSAQESSDPAFLGVLYGARTWNFGNKNIEGYQRGRNVYPIIVCDPGTRDRIFEVQAGDNSGMNLNFNV